MPNLYSKATSGAKAQRRPSEPIVCVRASDAPADFAAALDGALWRDIRPADIYLYFDTLKFLSRRAISASEVAMLREHCKKNGKKNVDIRYHGEWIVPDKGQPYQLNVWPWRFRIELQVPDKTALEYLGKRRGLKLTAAHLAADLTFDDENSKYRVLAIFEKHLVQPHQRKTRQNVRFSNGGISTGSKRKKGNYLTAYVSMPCRIDGVVDCWHSEDRRRGTEALEPEALAKIKLKRCDLATFRHEAYWQQFEATGHLLDIDLEHLARHHSNRHSGQRRQQSDPTPFHGRRSEDHWLGSWLFRFHGTEDEDGHISVQQFLKSHGKGPFVRKMAYLSAFQNISQIGRVDT